MSELLACREALIAEREARATDLAFYREMIAKHAAEVPKMAERVFGAVCEKCYYRGNNNLECCHKKRTTTKTTFTTCPLDGIVAIREVAKP